MSICWGAIISRLVVACEIVEKNFWPHLFQWNVDKLAFQRLQRPLSFVSPKTSLNQSSTSASAFISQSRNPRSPYCQFESRHLSLNMQNQCLQSAPSEIDPTGGKEGHASSLRLDATLAPSGSWPTPIPSIFESFNVPLESHLPQAYENHSDGVLAPLNSTIAAQSPCSSTPAHANNVGGLGDLKDDVKVVGINGQATGEIEVGIEEAGVTRVPSACPHFVQLTPFQGDTTRESNATTGTLSPSTALRPSSTALYISKSSPNLHWGSTISFPHSFAYAIPQPSM